MKKRLKVPTFKNEDEERDFWAKADLADYFDLSDFQSVSFPNLKRSLRPPAVREKSKNRSSR